MNIAARVQNLADADEIFISRDVFDAGDVKAKLAFFAVASRDAQLRSVEQNLQVFRVAPAAAERPAA